MSGPFLSLLISLNPCSVFLHCCWWTSTCFTLWSSFLVHSELFLRRYTIVFGISCVPVWSCNFACILNKFSHHPPSKWINFTGNSVKFWPNSPIWSFSPERGENHQIEKGAVLHVQTWFHRFWRQIYVYFCPFLRKTRLFVFAAPGVFRGPGTRFFRSAAPSLLVCFYPCPLINFHSFPPPMPMGYSSAIACYFSLNGFTSMCVRLSIAFWWPKSSSAKYPCTVNPFRAALELPNSTAWHVDPLCEWLAPSDCGLDLC